MKVKKFQIISLTVEVFCSANESSKLSGGMKYASHSVTASDNWEFSASSVSLQVIGEDAISGRLSKEGEGFIAAVWLDRDSANVLNSISIMNEFYIPLHLKNQTDIWSLTFSYPKMYAFLPQKIS